MSDAMAAWHRYRDASENLQVRPKQEELFAGLVAAVEAKGVAFGSAPCGAGKSAVVVPMREFIYDGGRVIHSSYTKSQQAQTHAFGRTLVDAKAFSAAVDLRGRSEYLCGIRRSWAGLPALEPGGAGLRSDCPPMSDEEWAASCSDSEAGCGAECGDEDWANRARAAAKTEGALVTINHAVLALDVLTKGALLGLGDKDVLVLDEAHQAPDAFRSALGASVTEGRLRRVRRLAVDRIGYDPGEGGIEALTAYLDGFDIDDHWRRTRDHFIYMKHWSHLLTDVQDWGQDVSLEAWRKGVRAADLLASLKGELHHAEAALEGATSEDGLTDLLAECDRLRRRCARASRDRDDAKRVSRVAERLKADLEMLESTFGSKQDRAVAWVEQSRGRSKRKRIEIRPLDVSDFAQKVFGRAAAAVAMSATVKWAVEDLGGGTLVEVGSPFDEATARVGVISRNGVDGKVDEERRLAEMVRVVRRQQRAGKGALVLASTQKQDGLSQIERAVLRLEGAGLKVGIQRDTGDVPRLVAGLKDGSYDVVVGTASMREGIDVPGDRLGVVVLMALAWPYMGDPLLRARMDRVPDKWRLLTPMMESNTTQAIGRLLRTPEDSGYVVLLDGRPGSVRHFKRLIQPSVVGAVVA